MGTKLRRLVALIGVLSMMFSIMPLGAMAAGSDVPADLPGALQATPPPAHAAASGFLFYKFPVPQPACTGFGLNVSGNAYFSSDDCGFVPFGIAGADSTADVVVTFYGPNGSAIESQDALYDSVDNEWQFSITPEATWPAGWITAVVFVDGEDSGQTGFGHRLLGASVSVDAGGAPYGPGDDLPVTGNIAELDTVTNLTGVQRTGVPATFTLAVRTPSGEVRPVPGGPITADAAGNYSSTIPGSLTADLEPVGSGVELTIAVLAIDATYDDPSTGQWAAAEAGSAPVTLLAASDAVSVEASFVSSVGWVKPGEAYPFRIFVTNATTSDAENVSVTLSAPSSATFQDATPLTGAGTAAVAPTSITWNVGTVPAANEAGPNTRTLVVTARAASLAEDNEVVWKDLSTTASLTYDGYSGPAITSATHGPKVIPPAAEFDTARYGDKPFPMVPVEWVDLDRQNNDTWDNDSEKLDTIVNDPGFVGSTFNLYQEMSFGQLFPQGSVPSAGIATAAFSDYDPGFDFTTTDRTNPLYAGCRGATFAEPGLVGTAAFDTRIEDGWYQMPGTTEYYGGDFPAFTATTVAIDQACGPIGKAVFDAAQIADPEIDYNEYDSDKDGVVDFFMMVFVGCGGNGASQIAVICEYFGGQAPFYDNIWPHSASLEGMYQDSATGLRGYISDDQLKSLTEIPQCWTSANRTQYTDCASGGGTGVDSLPVYVRVGPYNVNPETVFQSASVISHEYGHHLGLPDFYNSSAEVYGDLNLMAADYSQHMTIFGKQEMGWVVPEFLDPGETRNVSGWNEIKNDTGTITWQKPNGEIYTLSAANGDQNIHNGQAYALKLGGRQLIDPGDIPSGTHAWWSGRGNDFGCSPSGAHNLDIALPELAAFDPGTTVTVEFESSWDIEWDYDYGFVLTTTDGVFYTSHASQNGYTTTNDFNPNSNGCMTELNNGLTGTSGAYEQGVETVARAPLANDYSHGAPFLADAYDISDLAGNAGAVLRFSYSTDPGFDRPGWFIDDVVVRADGQVIYSSDFEDTDDLYRYTTDGWNRVNASDDNPADHAYYLELRDQSGFDFDGHGQSDRGDTAWQPGIFIDYTDEAHGYGNNGTPPPPAQHYLDSQPIPGSDCVDEQTGNCQDVSFTSAAGDDFFTDAINAEQPEGFINSFDDPNSKYGDGFWHFDYGCLTLDVTSMSGQDIGPVSPAYGNLTADAVISAGEGCTAFGYGAGDNLPPTAVAQARPTETTVNSPVTFDGSGSYDDRQTAGELTYGWDFGDDTTATGQSVVHSYDAEGVYTATLTVTDLDGASSTDTVTVTVDNSNTGDDTCRNDLCADKEKPQELTLTFVGGSCADSANSQGKKADCWDHEQGGASGDVFIRATNKEDPSYDNAKVWFEGDVADGGQFTLQAALEDEDDFGSKVFIHIYDGEGGTLLQTVEIHTSCSVPLIEGEQFGSLTLGGSEVDPDQPVCSKGEGRVHGSGHWDRATEEKYDKVDFSFDAKHYKGALKGKLKVHDKGMDFKIDAKTITSLTTGTDVDCGGVILDGESSFAFTALGSYEFGDIEGNGAFFACGIDNGKNNELPLDYFYVECTSDCVYSTRDRVDGNDIDGGNIHLHDPIVDPVNNDPAAAPQPGAGESPTAPAGGDSGASEAHVITLDPILLSQAVAGTPVLLVAEVEGQQGLLETTSVTLHWVTADGTTGQAAALTDVLGVATFAVTMPADDVEYYAVIGDLESNGVRISVI